MLYFITATQFVDSKPHRGNKFNPNQMGIKLIVKVLMQWLTPQGKLVFKICYFAREKMKLDRVTIQIKSLVLDLQLIYLILETSHPFVNQFA